MNGIDRHRVEVRVGLGSCGIANGAEPVWEALQRGAEEADRRFAELVERGQDLAAVELARRAHGESLTAAKARLDAARRGADGSLGRPTAARR